MIAMNGRPGGFRPRVWANISLWSAIALGILSLQVTGCAKPKAKSMTLTSIAVAPMTAFIAAGGTQQFKAFGTFSDGHTENITSTVTWSSSNTAVAAITNPGGLATGAGLGTTTITALSGTIMGTASVTVSAALASIAVTPTAPTIAVGVTQQFVATGTFSDGTTQDLTATATWASSVTTVATITNPGGLATAVALGTTVITAASGTVTSAPVTLTVAAAATLTSIAVTPANPSIAVGANEQFIATGTFSDGSMSTLTTETWSSSSTATASISTSGLASALAAGSSIITATCGTITGTTTLTVTTSATLTSIAVTPASPSIAVGGTEQFTATGTYSDGSTKTLTTETWTSSSTATATISSSGLATGLAAGVTTITATCGTIAGTTTLTVTTGTVTLVSIAVTPASPSIAVGATQQFTATGTFSDGSTQDLTTSATWTSSPTSVATISNPGGLATGVAAGTATITAISGTVLSPGDTLTVTAAVGLNNLLTGQYAFLLSGNDVSGKYGVAGSFTANGSGTITAGEINFGDPLNKTHDNLTGTYTIGTDGRGTLTLTTGDIIFGSGGVSTFLVSMQSAQHGLLIEAQGGDNQLGLGQGSLDLQNPAAFHTASITGGYAFLFDGVAGGATLSTGGVFTADGIGTFSSGTADLVNNFVASSVGLAGTFTSPDANGVGTATFTPTGGATAAFAYYIVDGNTLRFVENDTTAGSFAVGSAFGQGGLPNFTNASLNGSYAFSGSGTAADSSGALALGGLFTADGNGNITTGIFDSDDHGTLISAAPFTGTYVVATNGRATVTLTGLTGFTQAAFYLTANSGVLFLQNDAHAQLDGTVLLQTGAGSFTAASLTGNYAAAYRTTPFTTGSLTDVIGQVISNGISAFTGTLDLEAEFASLSATPVTGAYVAASNGRFTGSLNTGTNFVPDLTASFYVVDTNTVLFISQDTSEVASGIMQLQQLTGLGAPVKCPVRGAPPRRTGPAN